ncbi:MAG: hypothetical protein ACERKV_10375 [Clostridiaceae bacterium]
MEYNCEGKKKVAELLINCEYKKFIVFFEKKLLAITLEKTFIKKTNKELKKMLKSEGKGFFARIGKADEYWDVFGERFLYMIPEEIVEEFKKTVAIEYTDVKDYFIRPFKKDGMISEGSPEDKLGDIDVKSKERGKKISFEHCYAVDDVKYEKMISYFEKKVVNADGYIEK